MSEYISTKELAKYLGVSYSTVRRMIKDGKLPFIKPQHQYRFLKSQVIKFLKKKK